MNGFCFWCADGSLHDKCKAYNRFTVCGLVVGLLSGTVTQWLLWLLGWINIPVVCRSDRVNKIRGQILCGLRTMMSRNLAFLKTNWLARELNAAKIWPTCLSVTVTPWSVITTMTTRTDTMLPQLMETVAKAENKIRVVIKWNCPFNCRVQKDVNDVKMY